ncbi:N-acetylmuramoyl-L-alanine amidase family protein [Thermophagus xiamenensis]|uniref:N-acetylmuramoyl-L-alanine amidase n=1 Tax=Thermophagus xiamenensis TaxID=385682 RepID=A0A1I1W9L5_9BACT|nr:N-acetylmuramoyl-L-alanine amidase [Thermophagus xiamenensis]SFD91847.1 N-acetylmuramoyl-L-alanine amidase [Thermophagus xiamenensis]
MSRVVLLSFLFLFIAVKVYGQASEAERFRLKTVVIDPGHGGKDTGAIGRHHKEKDIVLDIALKVRDYLRKYLPELNVIMTREEDVFVPLDERARIANENDADLFVSIHANSIRNPRIYGAETFVLGLHRSEENLEVAKKENSVIVLEDDYKAKYEGFDPDLTESYIIFELMQNVYLDESISFASAVQNQFKNRVGRYDRGVKQAGFLVLRETSMPGVLIEVGFISNRNEERFMASESGKVYLASAIFRAIRDYKESFDARNSNLLVQNNNEAIQNNEIQYRIQIATSMKPIPKNEGPYKHFDDVWEYQEGNYYKYTTGLAYSYEEIEKLLPQVKAVVPDCFIVGFRNGERVIP